MYDSLDLESEIEVHLATYLEKVLEPIAKGALQKGTFEPNFTPEFLSALTAYRAMKTQEKLSEQNNRLQTWLAIFSGIAIIVPIVVELISKFG